MRESTRAARHGVVAAARYLEQVIRWHEPHDIDFDFELDFEVVDGRRAGPSLSC